MSVEMLQSLAGLSKVKTQIVNFIYNMALQIIIASRLQLAYK